MLSRKQRLWPVLVLVGAGVLVLVLFIRRSNPHWPTYEGKSAKEWSLQALISPDAAARAKGAEALRGMGSNAVPELAMLLEQRDSAVQTGLWKFGAKLPRVLRVGLLRNFKPPDAGTTRRAAAHGLALLGPDARAALPALGRVLQSGDIELLFDAGGALANLGVDALPILINTLAHTNPTVHVCALRALAANGTNAQAALPLFMKDLRDPNPSIRAAAAEALTALGKIALPPMLAAVEGETGPTRRLAAQVLGQISPPRPVAVPILLKMLEDPEAASRRQAIETLSRIYARTNTAINAITRALQDEDESVRAAATGALQRLAPAKPATAP